MTQPAFTDEQKKYLAERIKAKYPSLYIGSDNNTQLAQDAGDPPHVFGTPIDELCKEERIKHEKNGLDVWDQIVANANADQFPEPADMFRYKFYGLFHVKPAQDSFMLRCRIPGCQLRSFQLRGLAEIAKDWGGGYADITTRGNFQIREIMPRDTVNTLVKLTELGLTSKGSGADNVRNVTASPTSGFDNQELIDVLPLAKSMHHAILNNRDLYGLPRKFNISFDSGGSVSVCADTNDIGFYAVQVGPGQGVEQGVYFRLQLCGISGHKQLASDCGLLVKPEECVDLSSAILRVFIEHGDRTDRRKARLKYLVDAWGVDKLLEKTQEKLKFPLRYLPLDQCEPAPTKLRQAHYGIHPQKEPGMNFVGAVIPVGRMSPQQMVAIANLSERYAQGDIRLTVWQNLIIPHIPDAHLEAVKKELIKIGFHYTTTAVSGGLVACTGNTGCKFAAANTKGQAVQLAKYIEQHVELDQPINIHLTGCPHSCAQHYIGDIGLQATPCKVGDKTVEGYHIVLGGGVDDNRSIAKDIFQSVPFEQVPPLVKNILNTYLSARKNQETFAAFTRRHSETELQSLFSPANHA